MGSVGVIKVGEKKKIQKNFSFFFFFLCNANCLTYRNFLQLKCLDSNLAVTELHSRLLPFPDLYTFSLCGVPRDKKNYFMASFTEKKVGKHRYKLFALRDENTLNYVSAEMPRVG
jgi:hypothetical protein